MDAGIADTINRTDARLIAENLDRLDTIWNNNPAWHARDWATLMLGDSSDRAWILASLAKSTPNVRFDDNPADCDWDNLFSHFRAEILARCDPQTHSAHAAEIPARDGVGSR